MMTKDILAKIKKSNLKGRGGAGFPTELKWEMVKKAAGKNKYVVCNASEGEPGILKDKYLLENYPEKIIKGMKIAIEYLGAQRGYIYLNPKYFNLFKKRLEKYTEKTEINIVKKRNGAGYIGGEETSLLNAIEGKRIEPRLRPPYPTSYGLYGCPTLINNVETFFDVALIDEGIYKGRRFYTIGGDCLWPGVYRHGENISIKDVLKKTNNYPDFDFFVQIGGDGSGEILNDSQLDKPANGGGSITIYSIYKHAPLILFKRWVDFFAGESCGKCTPCREGTYRLKEILESKKIDWIVFGEILNNLRDSSFCALGASVPVPIKSYVKNVLSAQPKNKINIDEITKKIICESILK